MLFHLELNGTIDDFISFNIFHQTESARGKQQARKNTIISICILTFLALYLALFARGPFTVAYGIFFGLYVIFRMVFYKKLLIRNVTSQIRKRQVSENLPFDSTSRLEFYEDKLVEITPTTRMEQSYEGIERVCVVKDRYLYLYHSSTNAYVIPIPQLRAQASEQAFLTFLSRKCRKIEHFET